LTQSVAPIQEVLDQGPLGRELMANSFVRIAPHLPSIEVDHQGLRDVAVIAGELQEHGPTHPVGQESRPAEERLDPRPQLAEDHGNGFTLQAPGFGVIAHIAGLDLPDGTHHGVARVIEDPAVAAELCSALGG
jgi:hypothetical protein